MKQKYVCTTCGYTAEVEVKEELECSWWMFPFLLFTGYVGLAFLEWWTGKRLAF